MLFEMLTGTFLFDPVKENHIKKSEDHLLKIKELLGEYP